MTYRERRRHRRGSRKRNKVLLGLGVALGIGGLAAVSVVAWILSVAASAPPLKDLKPIDQGTSSLVYAADGTPLGYIQSDEVRTPVELSKIPKFLQQATIAIEDANFYHHGGVDYSSIARAAIADVSAGKAVQGGSTITQQLVRNLYIADPKRDIERKIKEAKLADDLESVHSKNWILNQYLNTVPYGTIDGRSAIGVQAASQTYFNKDVNHLDIVQAALLAGLPQSPTDYNPFLNPTAARQRRNEVLQKMAQHGYISNAEATKAYTKGLQLHRGYRYTRIREPFFFDYVEQQLIDKYGINTVRRGGLKVHSTIEPALQDAGTAAIDGVLNYPGDPSAAVVTIDPHNGYIKAMASSSDYKHQQYNLAAEGHRQPGSAMKTFVLATAIRQGVNPNTTYYTSKELNLNLPQYGQWHVQTYSHSYSGSMSIEQATLASDNTVYAQLDLDLGPKAVRQTAYDMGITTHLDALPAEGLGGLRLGVSPLEMADAYATLADGGVRNTPTAIKKVEFPPTPSDPNGRVDDLGKEPRRRAFSDAVAYEVTKILKANVQGGTGTAANYGCPAAGKTGTTDNFNDAWFVGYTPEMSTAVWVGYPDALREMNSVHGIAVAGGTFPAQIWHNYMTTAHGTFCGDFPLPTSTIEWKPFNGTYTSSGGSSYSGGTPYTPPSPNTGGNGHGYNPNLYAPGAGQGPAPSPQPTPQAPNTGGNTGGSPH